MRKLGDFKIEKEALLLWSFLSKAKIESSLEEKEDGKGYEIWISDEDKINQANIHYQEFLRNQDDPKFKVKLKDKPKTESFSSTKESGFKQYDLRNKWRTQEKSPGIVTLGLIILSVAVFLISEMGQNTQIVGPFFISEEINGGLNEIISGQFWRLITPIFLHFNFLHILFNSMWLHSLGSQIEKKKGAKFFITFILCTAIVSNLTQFLITGPAFGGMSGVVYGLFGYVWIKSRLDPGDGFHIDPIVAMVMLGFFFVCFTGAFGGVANWAHAGGLVVGLCWGYGSAFKWNLGGKKN